MLIDFHSIPLSVDALFGDSHYKELSNWIRCHRLAGCAAECDGLEDSLFARTIGNASHLALRLPGRGGDKLQGQASIVAAWRGVRSKGHPHVFKKLLPLRLRKTECEPATAHPGYHPPSSLPPKNRAHHLQTIAAGFVTPKHQGRCF